jgi:hypothetical protein
MTGEVDQKKKEGEREHKKRAYDGEEGWSDKSLTSAGMLVLKNDGAMVFMGFRLGTTVNFFMGCEGLP